MRAGVMLLDLTAPGVAPMLPGAGEQHAPVGGLMDEINARFGLGTVALGKLGARVDAPWGNKQSSLSPGFTTDWAALRTVS